MSTLALAKNIVEASYKPISDISYSARIIHTVKMCLTVSPGELPVSEERGFGEQSVSGEGGLGGQLVSQERGFWAPSYMLRSHSARIINTIKNCLTY